MSDGQTFPRILGVDYGERRIGLALSDPLCIFAQPWGHVENDAKWQDRIVELVRKEGVETIVVGMPLTLKGTEGTAAAKVRTFIETLRSATNTSVVTWDERFTTTMAQNDLRALETSKKKRNNKSGRLDAMAAAMILQGYLDATKHSRVC